MAKKKELPEHLKDWSDDVHVKVVSAPAGFLPQTMHECCEGLNADGFQVIACNVVQPSFYLGDEHRGVLTYMQRMPQPPEETEKVAEEAGGKDEK